jgi:hypothetical protein
MKINIIKNALASVASGTEHNAIGKITNNDKIFFHHESNTQTFKISLIPNQVTIAKKDQNAKTKMTVLFVIP